MNILEYYYKSIIKYNLINKFSYDSLKKIPKMKKIVLNFNCKNSELKNLAIAFIMLELITTNKTVTIKKSKNSNIFIKTRNGHPVGCTVILKNKNLYVFFFKLLVNILPILKDFKGIVLNKNKKDFKSFEFSLKELETNHYLFNNLPPLNVNIITNAKTKKELSFLISSLKIPLIKNIKSNNNSIGRV